MSRITVLTLGSRGDVQPYVALGKGLQAAGHDVTIATAKDFAQFVCQNGLQYTPRRPRQWWVAAISSN